ncbi:putative quinol monooxygenase [Devosia sp. 1566]|jgi:quinol monooxygenase YgiN|uniref:putative quinol monooxygenase n=1 Tax=Devosia sp. 1566 TaxID=2499144 RepID=UPI000FD7A698|nr:putative quinol monooxygenase [Devosia sp. 1566]
MYGLIGKLLAAPGKRVDLLEILMEGNARMPGCLSYVVAIDPASTDGIWVTEVWDNKDSHAASLQLPRVQQMIARARPIIAGFGERFETEPLGGVGLLPQTVAAED